MTIQAGRWELVGNVVRIARPVVICLVTAHAGVWRVVVIPVVAIHTTYSCMRPVQCIKIVVDREARRFPTWRSGMAQGTIRRKAQGLVVGVDGLIKIWGMASGTLRWCTDITIRMALNTIRRKVRAR